MHSATRYRKVRGLTSYLQVSLQYTCEVFCSNHSDISLLPAASMQVNVKFPSE